MTVLAIKKWRNNGELIADCAELGYLHPDWGTLDPTYGYGTFWKVWRPAVLIACDLDPRKSPIGHPVDFTKLPFAAMSFAQTVFDPPYKLNGRSTEEVDERYGVHEPARWQDRMDLILRGLAECCRVTTDHILVKCQDQVVSGKKRWQTDEITRVADENGFGKVDRFDFLSHRKQPEGRAQVHAECCSSQMLVFRRGWRTSHEVA